MKELKIILAVAKHNLIAVGTKLPDNLADDFRIFKEKISGCPIIMGRKTAEAFQNPLPNCLNLVLTHNNNLILSNGFLITHSAEEALRIANSYSSDKNTTWIIGGAEIVQLFIKQYHISESHLTMVDADYSDYSGLKTFLDLSALPNPKEIRTEHFEKRDPSEQDLGNCASFTIYTYKY